MKYKIGDKVRVKSLEWYNSKKSDYGFTIDDVTFDHQMSIYCGRLAMIEKLGISYYRIDIDNGELYFSFIKQVNDIYDVARPRRYIYIYTIFSVTSQFF